MPVQPVIAPVEPGGRDAPGWYGKLSTLGDFAQRRLPVEFVQTGDAWLSLALNASRQQLGEHWLDAYLTAPVMRFAWAPGVVDEHWWFGVLMPSCDNVGRYFPLLIAQRRTLPPLDSIALNHLEAWFDHLAHAATGTLGELATIETFEQALANAPPWPTQGAPPALSPRPISGGEHYALGLRDSIGEWLHAMAADELLARFKGGSIWWRQSAAAATAVSLVSGLPDPTSFAQMLSG